MYRSFSSTEGWLTPESLAALRAIADRESPDTDQGMREIARQLSADVRARDGSAAEMLVAVKAAWSETRRSRWPVPTEDAERLSRLVSLCIDEYYGVRR